MVVLTFDLNDRIIVDVFWGDHEAKTQEQRFDQVVDRGWLVALDSEVVKLLQIGQIQAVVTDHLTVFVDRSFSGLDTDHSVAIHQTLTPRPCNRSGGTKREVRDFQG
ncbi:hypothetical protein D3C71_1644430 [compost metagenome]